MTDNDRCQCCFEEETIRHLLIECPYTKQVWTILNIQPMSLSDVILHKSIAELEILAEFLSELVFRKKVIPPSILVRNIYRSYADGLCRNKSVKQLANRCMAYLTN